MEEHTPTKRAAPTAARRRRTLTKLQNSLLHISQIGQTNSTNQIPSADQQCKMPRRSTGSTSATGRVTSIKFGSKAAAAQQTTKLNCGLQNWHRDCARRSGGFNAHLQVICNRLKLDFALERASKRSMQSPCTRTIVETTSTLRTTNFKQVVTRLLGQWREAFTK